MKPKLEIRECVDGDHARIFALYPQAFPDEDLLPLLRDLLACADDTLHLVALIGDTLVGHVTYTTCRVEAGDRLSLLGPLAVHPDYQKQGIGSALIAAGRAHAAEVGFAKLLVLGDPAYYGRSGFIAERAVTPPYTLPPEWDGAWQGMALGDGEKSVSGQLLVPEPWRHAHLWLP